VAVFKWGVNGVGIATVIAQFASVVLVFKRMMNMDERYNLKLNELRIDKSVLGEVMILGLPAAIQASITSIANVFTARYINNFTKSATAGIPTAQKIDQFAGLAAQAVALAIPTYISQNVGAGKYDRSLKGVSQSVIISAFLTVIPGTVIYFIAPQCARIFTDDPAVIEIIVGMLHTIMPFYIFMGFNNIFAGIVRGFQKSIQASVCNIMGMVVVRQIWLALSLRANMDIQNIFWGYPIGWIASTIFAGAYYLLVVKKEAKKLHQMQLQEDQKAA
jgi:Na+-driven multidrug efflux pump